MDETGRRQANKFVQLHSVGQCMSPVDKDGAPKNVIAFATTICSWCWIGYGQLLSGTRDANANEKSTHFKKHFTNSMRCSTSIEMVFAQIGVYITDEWMQRRMNGRNKWAQNAQNEAWLPTHLTGLVGNLYTVAVSLPSTKAGAISRRNPLRTMHDDGDEPKIERSDFLLLLLFVLEKFGRRAGTARQRGCAVAIGNCCACHCRY